MFVLLNTTISAPCGYSRIDGTYGNRRDAMRALSTRQECDDNFQVWCVIDAPDVHSFMRITAADVRVL
jgi:hypothetical protein